MLSYGRLTQTGLPSLRYFALVRLLLWSQRSSQPHFSFTFPLSPNPRPIACAWDTQYMKMKSDNSHIMGHLLYQTCLCKTRESFLQEGLKVWEESLQEQSHHRCPQFLLQMPGLLKYKHTAKSHWTSNSEIQSNDSSLPLASQNTRPQQSFLPQEEMREESGDRC